MSSDVKSGGYMGSVFSSGEVAEVGIKIEENGRDFYNGALKLSTDEKAREVFQFLSGEEEKHIRQFEALRENVKKYEPAEAYPEEYFSYLKSLSEDYVFTREKKGSEVASEIKSDRDAVDLGIEFEKKSISFYEGMKKVVPEKEHIVIDKLIEEEKNHLERLVKLKGEKKWLT